MSILTNPLHVQIGKLRHGADMQTVLIGVQDRDRTKKWKACGTAFPILFEGRIFLVSAAHNFVGLTDHPAVLIGTNGSVRLYRDNFHLVGNSLVDLALIALNSDDLKTLFGTCTCIELDMESLPDRHGAYIHQAYGFPTSKNKHSNIEGWRLHGLRLSLGAETAIPARSKMNQFGAPIFGFELDPSQFVDNDGKRTGKIGLDGMSGGPVICHRLVDMSLAPGKVAGVFLEWHSTEKIAVVIPAMAIAAAVRIWHSL